MKKNYGIPYKGSKSKIVNKIMEHIPAADNFYDLFGGGFAVSHYVLEEFPHKFKYVHYNEIQKGSTEFIQKAISGYYNYNNFKPEFIDRDTFFKLKDSDWYIKYVWSFGNTGNSYLFGKHIEKDKKSLHNAIVFDVYDDNYFSILSDKIPSDIKNIKERRLYLRKHVTSRAHKDAQQLEQLERLQQLERLYGTNLTNLTLSTLSYEQVSIKPNSIIYCDIPYKGTDKYGVPFDREKFFNWAHEQSVPVFISEYNISDDRFHLVTEFEHRTTVSSTANNKVIERLYCNKAAHELIK